MELSPQSVSSTTFKIVKRGFDPAEVKTYLTQLAASIETTQNQATAMEARARAAVARLQEIASQQAAAPPLEPIAPPKPDVEPAPSYSGEADTISRTLLLAQRTADQTIAEANAEAHRLTDAADAEARTLISGAQEVANRLVDEARNEARRAGENQRVEIESEVQSLLARREFLLADVEHLEQHLVTQRERLRDVAGVLNDIITRVPGGMADMRRPLVSAVGESDADETAAVSIDDAATDDAAHDGGSPAFADPVATHAPDAPAPADDPWSAVTGPVDVIDSDSSTDAPNPTDTHAANAAFDGSGDEATPASGAEQFLFEDITEDVPRLRPRFDD